MSTSGTTTSTPPERESIVQPPDRTPLPALFLVFLRLGLTSFGGPIAHLAYYREAFVVKRRWLDERGYADLVALCQFLPGPASSQVSFAVGILRGGLPGGLLAWLAFTGPSALLLIAFAWGLAESSQGAGWLHGLKLIAVAVVAQAVWGMARNLCPDRERATIAGIAAVALVLWQTNLTQIAIIVLGAAAGALLLRDKAPTPGPAVLFPIGRRTAWTALVLFVVLLVGLPLFGSAQPTLLSVADAFYRTGALVFGGGHVVLPLLQTEVVGPGWLTPDAFLAGYGAAQAVPGPLFTFAGYLGMVVAPNGAALTPPLLTALVAVVAIFLPGLLLVVGTLPFWNDLRNEPHAQAVLLGVNAAVVGLLGAALYDPIWISAVRGPLDFAIALTAFLALQVWKAPVWAVVGAAALAGWVLL